MQEKNEVYEEMVKELIDRAAYDLEVRKELAEAGELMKYWYHPRMKEVHEENLIFLTDYLTQFNWPSPSIDGREAFEAAWFIAIHAIEHKEQMKQALIEVKKLLDRGENVAHEYSCLYDRIALFEGRQQRYATQFWPSENGWHFKNLESEITADHARRSIGLSSFEDKKKEIEDYTDESGFIEDDSIIDQNFQEWCIRSGWRD